MTPDTLALNLIPTYTVFSRHSATCPDIAKGEDWVRCSCRKWLRVYDPRIQDPAKRQDKWSLKTRDAAEAERIAQAYRDKHNPDKVARARAEAELESRINQQKAQSATATIEEAVARFLIFKKDNPSRRSSRIAGKTAESTMDGYKHLLGDVNPKSFEVIRKGRLFTWLETLDPRPVYISDLTNTLVDGFRATWDFPSDLTRSINFTKLKTFFVYCRDRGHWILQNPLDGVPRPTIQEGSRTAAFTDGQYNAIINTLDARASAVIAHFPATTKLDDEKKLNDVRRLRTLVELMRWGGLALHDAVDFKQTALNGDELRYRRQKTNRWAKPILPGHVVDLLRTVVPINGDPNQPFRDISVRINSDKNYWSRLLKELFAEAGIGKVVTEIRERDAHAHMLRDTFAVGQLERHIRDGKPSLKSIADAMGDSVPVMLKHYAPIIDKLERAHAEEQRKVVAAQVAEMAQNQKKQADVIPMPVGSR